MLVSSASILKKASQNGYAVGAFNVYNLETIHAAVDTSAAKKSPLILQTSEAALTYAGVDYLKAITYIAAQQRIPIALHVDHGKDIAVIKECIKKGWTSVMFDGSLLPFEKNVRLTRDLVRYAKPRGVSVEGELGAIKGVEDLVRVKDRQVLFTDPSQASEFVSRTGVDALAISIGTAHGPFKFQGEPFLDFLRLKKIKEQVAIPLVLHGASGIAKEDLRVLHRECRSVGDCERLEEAVGIADKDIKKAIRFGIAKVNIDSDLRIAFLAGIREAIVMHHDWYDPRKILGEGSVRMKKVIAQKIKLFGSKGRA